MPTEIINITCLKIKYRQRQHNSKQRIAAVAFGSFDCLYIQLHPFQIISHFDFVGSSIYISIHIIYLDA